MKFTFTEKRIQVSDEIKDYARKKIGKLNRFFKNQTTEAFVTFSAERGRYRAEVTLHNNGMFYRVSELTSDMYASIDSACAAIEQQIRKNKARLEKRLREGAFEREIKPKLVSEDMEEGEGDKDEFKIVRTKKFFFKPMSPEEAILQMNLLKHEFFAFKNQEDDSFSVVYRRKNGGYGLISASDM
ncbi:MAG TPA: ribosome-associated translation inhibitor RaiA [Clostridiales bacterium]|nr:ribosome-associated translation inhibitor RaiA [Clostridiales bacterium]